MNSLFLNSHLAFLKIWLSPSGAGAGKAGNMRERYICSRPVSNRECSTESTVTCKAESSLQGNKGSVVHSVLHKIGALRCDGPLSQVIKGTCGVLIQAKLFEINRNFVWVNAARFGSG